MDYETADIWFGPGARKGVFGAGVAHGLSELITRRELDASRLRLYGSSIGCLTAVFLATGNAACGLSIFREETHNLVSASKLMPALGTRFVNRLALAARRTNPLVRVPSVLNLDHVFDVMARRTPNIVDQLNRSPMPVFAETVNRSGSFRHVELRAADEPLHEIRLSLNCFPFTGMPDSELMDSVIKGYGFIELVRSRQRPLVIVLNVKPTTRSAVTFGDLACAAFSADFRIAQLYLRRRGNQRTACQSALQAGRNVLLISPPRAVSLSDPSGYEAAHQLGRDAAQRIVAFLESPGVERSSVIDNSEP